MKLPKDISKKKRIGITLILVFLVILLVLGGGLFWWQKGTYLPNEKAISTINSSIIIDNQPQYIQLTNSKFSSYPQTGIIFYPGARIDPSAYETLLSKLPETSNTKVFIAKFPLNLAILGLNSADEIIKDNTDISSWYIAGHSLGGAMISEYLKGTKYESKILGVIYMGAYPNDNYLLDKKYKILSLYGSEDKLATPEKINDSKTKLPSSSLFIQLPSNHSQFGDYGHQEGDGNQIQDTDSIHVRIIEIIREFIGQPISFLS
ncbi:MAG: alpha/beta hydrolase [bacterium]